MFLKATYCISGSQDIRLIRGAASFLITEFLVFTFVI